MIAADVDGETAEEVCLWFDLTQHYPSRPSEGTDSGDLAGDPLDQVTAPPGGEMTAARAIALVVEQIRARRLDYPTQGLAADRFAAGWSVYAPVDVDESDPMAFLDMPVGRSVFLVSDVGRIKESSSSVPPQQAEKMFTAEEAYVRRRPAEERFFADLEAEVMRLGSESEGSLGISSFTVDAPSEEVVAARASRLIGPIVQQLALLGPPGWDRFEAVFSFTVSGEVAQLRFRSGNRSTEVRVPEQLAVLVRRQRHLAAEMPAGPWWRLLLTVSHNAGANVRTTTEYDYGDQPLPDDQLLAPERYRDDLAAYPRAHTPAWLSEYVAGAAVGSGPVAGAAPRAAAATARPSAPGQDRSTPSPARPASAPGADAAAPGRGNTNSASAPPLSPVAPTGPPPGQVPVLDTVVRRKRLYADPHMISFGRKSIAMDQVEWVSYTATHTATKRFMFPTTHDSAWNFQVDKYPYHGGLGREGVLVHFDGFGRNAQTPAEWTFLVNLARQYLEPRLVAELVAGVRRGETVTVGASVKVNQDGISCARPRISLPWRSISGTRPWGGTVWIYQAGVEKPVLNVPLRYPNAALIPELFATFMT